MHKRVLQVNELHSQQSAVRSQLLHSLLILFRRNKRFLMSEWWLFDQRTPTGDIKGVCGGLIIKGKVRSQENVCELFLRRCWTWGTKILTQFLQGAIHTEHLTH